MEAERSPECLEPGAAGERSVLLALREHDNLRTAVRRAVEAARALQARIHVLRVLPPGPRRTSVTSTRLLVSSLHVVKEMLAASSPSSSWGIPADEIVSSVAVLHGDFEQRTAAYAEAVGSTCVVLVSGGRVQEPQVPASERSA